jgi:hypothetical protein
MPALYIFREFGGSQVWQKVSDGYININHMADATGKRIDNWLSNQSTQDLLEEFKREQRLHSSNSRDVVLPLVTSRARVDRGGGTWAHPDIAIQFAQWCSPAFALQVSRWVREWMTTARNPVADMDRVAFRDQLKDKSRLELTDAIKEYLEQIRRYDDKRYCGQFFARSHNLINELITTENAQDMRERLSGELGKVVKESELIRDYFPPEYLQHYVAVCRSAANFMLKDDLDPLTAIEKAAEYALPSAYVPRPIDFVEHIKIVRKRLESSGGELA